MVRKTAGCGELKNRKEIEQEFKLLGDFWTLNIIDVLSAGEQRFCELQRNAGGVNPVTLVSRLKRLEEAGLIGRREETLDKLSVTYLLTKKGQDILPVIECIRSFAERHHTASHSKRLSPDALTA